MKGAVLCIFFFATVWALPMTDSEPQFNWLFADPLVDELPKDLAPRITHGEEAPPHSIPFQAYLAITNKKGTLSLCGGSLISPKHILTAGHCLDGGLSVTIYLGAHNLLETEDTRVVLKSKNLVIHENYVKSTFSNDIGIIVLDEAVELNENVNVVDLPTHDVTDKYEGANVRVSGWGRVAGDEGNSPVLLEVNSTVITNFQCRAIFSVVRDTQLCISGTGGVGSCKGDSGGPLVYDNVQIGLVSYGATNCKPGYPSGFTRITSYLDWIEEKTGLTF